MKYHYHHYSFIFQGFGFATVTMGDASKNITVPMIEKAKIKSNAGADSVLISVSYLGYMTQEEMIGESE